MTISKLIDIARCYVFSRVNHHLAMATDKTYYHGIINTDSHITFYNYLNKSNIDNCNK